MGSPRSTAGLLAIGMLAVLSTTLGACSSSEDEDEAEAREVVEQGFTEPNPQHCTDLATQRFLDQTEAPRDGEEALESCRKDAEEDPEEFADEVDVSEVAIDGEAATVTAMLEGGASDGMKFTLALVKEEGRWKIDRLEDVEIDRQRFNDATRRNLTESEDVSEKEADCIIAELDRRLSDSEIERAFVEPDPSVFIDVVLDCRGGDGDPRAAFLAGLRRSLVREQGLTRAQANCVVRQVRDDVNAADVRDIIGSGPPQGLELALEAAARKCIVGTAPVPPADEDPGGEA